MRKFKNTFTVKTLCLTQRIHNWKHFTFNQYGLLQCVGKNGNTIVILHYNYSVKTFMTMGPHLLSLCPLSPCFESCSLIPQENKAKVGASDGWVSGLTCRGDGQIRQKVRLNKCICGRILSEAMSLDSLQGHRSAPPPWIRMRLKVCVLLCMCSRWTRVNAAVEFDI